MKTQSPEPAKQAQRPSAAKKAGKWILFAAVMAALVALVIVSTKTPGVAGKDYHSPVFGTIWGLLPPVTAIVLALITKEVYSSLFIGIVIGALLYSGGNLELGLNTMLFSESGGIVTTLMDPAHAGIIIFVVILGMIVALLNKSGGAAAFGRWARKHIKTRIGAQLATVLLGVLIFVDDAFNCMTVGSVMRPITDRYKISRAKLAYIIDSTAAPVCIIAPISSWAAAVTYAVPEDAGINGFSMFLSTIPFNFYALCTLAMLIMLAVMKVDFGPMKVHEDNAQLRGDLYTTPGRPYAEEDAIVENENGHVSDLVLPVVALILCCIMAMLYTGGFFRGETFINAFGNCNAAESLVMGSLVALLFTFVWYRMRNVLSFKDFMECLPMGFRAMCAPMTILVLAWTLSGMTSLLGAKFFIRDLIAASAGAMKMFLPAIIFLVSVFLSFSTGTSWGTFTILIPIVCSVFPDSYEMLVISISACLGGAVCGDHCSPISDTTIMSSAGAHCEHVNHVSTQLLYAMTCAGVCAVGYLFAGVIGYLTQSQVALVSLPITIVLLMVVLLFIKRVERRRGQNAQN